jgi:hypothetical protein
MPSKGDFLSEELNGLQEMSAVPLYHWTFPLRFLSITLMLSYFSFFYIMYIFIPFIFLSLRGALNYCFLFFLSWCPICTISCFQIRIIAFAWVEPSFDSGTQKEKIIGNLFNFHATSCYTLTQQIIGKFQRTLFLMSWKQLNKSYPPWYKLEIACKHVKINE